MMIVPKMKPFMTRINRSVQSGCILSIDVILVLFCCEVCWIRFVTLSVVVVVSDAGNEAITFTIIVLFEFVLGSLLGTHGLFILTL